MRVILETLGPLFNNSKDEDFVREVAIGQKNAAWTRAAAIYILALRGLGEKVVIVESRKAQILELLVLDKINVRFLDTKEVRAVSLYDIQGFELITKDGLETTEVTLLYETPPSKINVIYGDKDRR